MEEAAPVDAAILLVALAATDVAEPWLRDADPVAAEAAEEEERAVEDAMLLEAIEEAIEDDIIDDDIIEDDIIDDDIMEDDAAALEAEADDPPTAAPPAEPSAPRTPP